MASQNDLRNIEVRAPTSLDEMIDQHVFYRYSQSLEFEIDLRKPTRRIKMVTNFSPRFELHDDRIVITRIELSEIESTYPGELVLLHDAKKGATLNHKNVAFYRSTPSAATDDYPPAREEDEYVVDDEEEEQVVHCNTETTCKNEWVITNIMPNKLNIGKETIYEVDRNILRHILEDGQLMTVCYMNIEDIMNKDNYAVQRDGSTVVIVRKRTVTQIPSPSHPHYAAIFTKFEVNMYLYGYIEKKRDTLKAQPQYSEEYGHHFKLSDREFDEITRNVINHQFRVPFLKTGQEISYILERPFGEAFASGIDPALLSAGSEKCRVKCVLGFNFFANEMRVAEAEDITANALDEADPLYVRDNESASVVASDRYYADMRGADLGPARVDTRRETQNVYGTPARAPSVAGFHAPTHASVHAHSVAGTAASRVNPDNDALSEISLTSIGSGVTSVSAASNSRGRVIFGSGRTRALPA